MLRILKEPHPCLYKTCEDVVSINQDLRDFVCLMFEAMYHAQGIGLAAPQVGRNINLFIMDVGDPYPPCVFLNPKIHTFGKKKTHQEGCLSLPDQNINVERFDHVTVVWQNLQSKKKEKTFFGLESICIQHEYDHLQGKTISRFAKKKF